jgi:hypothetical protein
VFSCLIPPTGLQLLGIGIPKNETATPDENQQEATPTFSFQPFTGPGLAVGGGVPEANVEESVDSKREKSAMAAYKRMSHYVL